MIKVLSDQPDLVESVFMPVVNLYYKSDLTSDSSFCTASNGGLAVGSEQRHTCTCVHANRRTQICSKSGSRQRPVSITINLRSVKFNDLLYPLVPSNKLQH